MTQAHQPALPLLLLQVLPLLQLLQLHPLQQLAPLPALPLLLCLNPLGCCVRRSWPGWLAIRGRRLAERLLQREGGACACWGCGRGRKRWVLHLNMDML